LILLDIGFRCVNNNIYILQSVIYNKKCNLHGIEIKKT
jgi:hypothetical protein